MLRGKAECKAPRRPRGPSNGVSQITPMKIPVPLGLGMVVSLCFAGYCPKGQFMSPSHYCVLLTNCRSKYMITCVLTCACRPVSLSDRLADSHRGFFRNHGCLVEDSKNSRQHDRDNVALKLGQPTRGGGVCPSGNS